MITALRWNNNDITRQLMSLSQNCQPVQNTWRWPKASSIRGDRAQSECDAQQSIAEDAVALCFYLAAKQSQQILTSWRRSLDASQSIRSFVRPSCGPNTTSSINQRRGLVATSLTVRCISRDGERGRRQMGAGGTLRNSDRRCWSSPLRQQFRRHHVTMEIRLRRRHARRRVS